MSTERSRAAIKEPITVRDLTIARTLIDIILALEVAPAVSTKLVSLAPVLKSGCWVTQGHLQNSLPAIVGVSELQAHEWNHDDPKWTLARSQGLAWIL